MREINLIRHGIGRYGDGSPFIINGDLQLKIVKPVPNALYIGIIRLNGEELKVTAEGGILTVPEDKLQPGEMSLCVAMYLRGELDGRYEFSPLHLKEAEGSFTAEPVVTELRSEIAGIRKTCAECKKEFEEQIAALCADVERLLKDKVDGLRGEIAAGVKEAKLAADENAAVLNEKAEETGKLIAMLLKKRKKK